MIPPTLAAREALRRYREALRVLTGRTWTVRPCVRSRNAYLGLLIHAPRSRRLIAPDGTGGILREDDVQLLVVAMPWAKEKIEGADEDGVLILPYVLETLARLEDQLERPPS